MADPAAWARSGVGVGHVAEDKGDPRAGPRVTIVLSKDSHVSSGWVWVRSLVRGGGSGKWVKVVGQDGGSGVWVRARPKGKGLGSRGACG